MRIGIVLPKRISFHASLYTRKSIRRAYGRPCSASERV
jgi:hypothetical protein